MPVKQKQNSLSFLIFLTTGVEAIVNWYDLTTQGLVFGRVEGCRLKLFLKVWNDVLIKNIPSLAITINPNKLITAFEEQQETSSFVTNLPTLGTKVSSDVHL